MSSYRHVSPSGIRPRARLGVVSDRTLNRYMLCAGRLYGGAIARNQITGKPAGRIFFINLQPSRAGNGTHWCLLDARSRPFQYFDPFGMPPPTDIKRYGATNRTPVHWNTKDVQAYASSDCGWFCLFVAQHLLRGQSIRTALTRFTLNPNGLRNNDTVLLRYFGRS